MTFCHLGPLQVLSFFDCFFGSIFNLIVFSLRPVLLQEARVPSFDKQQRDFLKHLLPATFLEMILPYVRKAVEASVVKVYDVIDWCN